MSNAGKLKTFPDVTLCDAPNVPVASNLVDDTSLIAKCVAVPVDVTDALAIAVLTTFLPELSPF